MTMRWAALGRAAVGLVYPRRCPFCDEVLGQRTACPNCGPKQAALRRPVPRLAESDHLLAGLCGAAAVYEYDGVVQEAILRLKSGGRACYAPLLGAVMAEQLFGCSYAEKGGIIRVRSAPPAALEYGCVVPVPSGSRLRGYNPPGLLAGELASALGLPLIADALIKTRATPRQESLGREGRLLNLAGAFEVRPGRLAENSRVLLVDDVVTTGATLSSCAAALLKAGAGEVFGACLAATPPKPAAAYENQTTPARPAGAGRINER